MIEKKDNDDPIIGQNSYQKCIFTISLSVSEFITNNTVSLSYKVQEKIIYGNTTAMITYICHGSTMKLFLLLVVIAVLLDHFFATEKRSPYHIIITKRFFC